MDGPFRIGVVLSARPWSTRLHSFIADHVPNVELVMVRDQQAAIETSPDVLLVDESTPWLTASFVSRARSAGVRLVGVYERSGRAGQAHLAEVGISHQFEEAMPPDDVTLGCRRSHFAARSTLLSSGAYRNGRSSRNRRRSSASSSARW